MGKGMERKERGREVGDGKGGRGERREVLLFNDGPQRLATPLVRMTGSRSPAEREKVTAYV